MSLLDRIRELDAELAELALFGTLELTVEPDVFVSLARAFTVDGQPPSLSRGRFYASWTHLSDGLSVRVALAEKPSERPLCELPDDAADVWTELHGA